MNKLPITERSLGETEIHWLLWRKTGTLNHSALRRYYMTRNHILLAKEYIFSEPSWVLVTYIGTEGVLKIEIFHIGTYCWFIREV